jgi:hypothetical protein
MHIIDTSRYNRIYQVWLSLHIPVNAEGNAQSAPTWTLLGLISDAGMITVAIASTIQQLQLSHYSLRAAHDTSITQAQAAAACSHTLIFNDAPVQRYT